MMAILNLFRSLPAIQQQLAYYVVQWSWFAQMSALCNLLRKKSQEVTVSLSGQFLISHHFTLCITMEAEPRTANLELLQLQKLQEKGDGGQKKSVSALFFGWPEDHEFVEKMRFGTS